MISKTRIPEPVNGILVVDKPSGWTSHDVVNKVRLMLHGTKVGHTGTLDPSATGVLILLIGSATKSASIFENDTKRYHAEVTFGRSTDTYDADGVTTETGNPSCVDIDALQKAIMGLKGESEQVPPMFSAVKVGGRKLYQIARSGKTVERNARRIFISSIDAFLDGFPRVILDIECSKGTYIRSIAQQLGEMVGCPAHLSALRRTASGKFRIENAVDFISIAKSSNVEEIKGSMLPVPEPAESQ